jgi:hypothetical protein
MRSLALALLLAFAACGALAQQREHGPGTKGVGKAMQGERRTAQPVRGDPRDARRPERMSPEDREKLRRDIDDANRRMERRR